MGNTEVFYRAINFYLREHPLYLRESIADYDAFDQIALAQQLQKHQLLEFRRIAAHLYRTNKRYTTSIALSKQDNLWQDAMETAALSQDSNLAEELLRFFVENIEKNACPKSCFAACLFTCFELTGPGSGNQPQNNMAPQYGGNQFAPQSGQMFGH